MAEIQKNDLVQLTSMQDPHLSKCEGRWGGQETGSRVGWGNGPKTVWVVKLSLP